MLLQTKQDRDLSLTCTDSLLLPLSQIAPELSFSMQHKEQYYPFITASDEAEEKKENKGTEKTNFEKKFATVPEHVFIKKKVITDTILMRILNLGCS